MEIILLQDNARLHTLDLTMATLATMHSRVTHHPSYSPDLMYGPMKVHLRRQQCQTDNESKRGVLNWLSSRDKPIYTASISTCLDYENKIMCVKGDYLEKECEFGDFGVHTLFVNKVQVNLGPPTSILPDSPELMDL
jgi:hypothetical protein